MSSPLSRSKVEKRAPECVPADYSKLRLDEILEDSAHAISHELPMPAPLGVVPAPPGFSEYNFGIVAAGWSLPATGGASRNALPQCGRSLWLPCFRLRC